MFKKPLEYPNGSAVEKARVISAHREIDWNVYSKMCRYFVEEIATGASPITGRSKNKTVQDVGTPPEFLRCVQELFGRIAFDLAASKTNHVAEKYYTEKDDALAANTPWPKYRLREEEGILPTMAPWLWLNPPYKNIDPWLERCQAEKENGRNILVLIPASVGARWWSRWVQIEDGPVWASLGRMKFAGHTQMYPRDLALLIYSEAWEERRRNDGMTEEDLDAIGFLRPQRWHTKDLGQWMWTKFLKLLVDGG